MTILYHGPKAVSIRKPDKVGVIYLCKSRVENPYLIVLYYICCGVSVSTARPASFSTGGPLSVPGKAALHAFGHVDLEHGQRVADDVPHAQAQRDAGLLDAVLGAQDAAGAVEAVEGARHVDDKAGDAGGVVLFGRGGDLGGEGGQQPQQRQLGRVGQRGGVGGVRAGFGGLGARAGPRRLRGGGGAGGAPADGAGGLPPL